jgi:hypothetical protein
MPVVIKKYEFFTRKIDFIRFIIKLGYISIDLKKVKANVVYKRVANTSEPRTYQKLEKSHLNISITT